MSKKLKPLDGYVGVEGYFAGDDGYLYSTIESEEPKKLSRHIVRDYYYSKVNGKLVRIHRLIAWAFVDGYKEELVVNHKDEDKLNNKPNNLEWVTPKENSNYKKEDSGKQSRGGEQMTEQEMRHFQIDNIEVRKNDNDEVESFEGYVVKFDTRSHYLGFYEKVDKRAFDNTLKKDNNIFALFNHDWSKPLASTRNKSLELYTDKEGLRFKLSPKAKTTFLRDVRELVDSGELRGMSFGFIVNDDDWETRDGEDYRTLKDVDVAEITLTHNPAYESSEVNIRSHENYKEEKRKAKEKRDADLELLKLKSNLLKMKYNI